MDKIKYMWDFSDNRSQIREYYRAGGGKVREGERMRKV